MLLPVDDQSAKDEEAALLAKIAQQDQTALAKLYDRYAQVLYAVAFKIVGTVEEAEEVVLDVFHQVWKTAQRYDVKRGRVDTWLFMLTRSRSLDRLRALERIAQAAALTKTLPTQPLTIDPEEDVLIGERRARVLAALSQIPPAQRQVLEMAYYKGLTHVEIAAQTGERLGTVKTRIRLGLSKLRQILGTWE
ncbi:sigma-70 family RNA polymerase sigma factor [Chroococcidiopsis sp. TS-821]|nr:sigma-70 family RNA polymerase sigma factor [Chroococcidiopsis sp. TS-821]PPS41011.1 RNA polymerase [Chroococcidiopsis sp. TS-821]